LKYFSLTLCFLSPEENKEKKISEIEGINVNEKLNEVFILHAGGSHSYTWSRNTWSKNRSRYIYIKGMYTHAD